ncbi:MAG: hypothetical protein ABW174_00575 [Flavitalea sp.]
MKNNSINDLMFHCEPLSMEEMSNTNGGEGFWYTVMNVVGMVARSVYEVSRSAAEYQASLPPVHKK